MINVIHGFNNYINALDSCQNTRVIGNYMVILNNFKNIAELSINSQLFYRYLCNLSLNFPAPVVL